MKKFWKKTEGFTLVELVVVIAILGILAGVGTVGYSGYIKKANMAADQQLVRDVMNAVELAAYTEQQGIGDAAGVIGTVTLKQDGTVVEGNFTQKAMTNAFGAEYGSLKLKYTEWADDGLLAAMGDVDSALLSKVPTSTYITKIGTETLLGDVQDCATAFSGFLGQISAGNPKEAVDALNWALNPELGDEELLADSAFMQYLKAQGYVVGEDYSKVSKEMLANATVFGVAEQVKGNQAAVMTSFGNMYRGNTYQKLTATASLYDVAYWYAATEAVVGYLDNAEVREQFKAIDMTSNDAATIIGQMNVFADKLNANAAVSSDLSAYYSRRLFRDDAAAFFAVMSTVNGVSNDYKEDAEQMSDDALFTSGAVLNRVNSMVGMIPVMGSVEDGTIMLIVSRDGNGKVVTAVAPGTALPNG